MLLGLQIPDVIPYFLAILGLLLIWQLHEIQVQAGRIDAMDFWVISGIRLFVYATPCDTSACRACRKAHGLMFSPAYVASKNFRAEIPTCGNPIGCRCLLVGLYGAWPEAERARKQLKWNHGRIQVTDEQLEAFATGGKNRRAGFSADRISLILLEAMQMEKSDPNAAINRYRFVVEEAETKRDLPFVVPAYLRLSDLLETVGEEQEAHEVVTNFLDRYTKKKSQIRKTLTRKRGERYRPSESQLAVMSTRRTRLEARIGVTGPAASLV
jgi:hypothetical protein